MPPSASPTALDWETFKPVIHRVYLLQDASLSEVMALMRENGFDVKKHHCENQLKDVWGFHKRMTPDAWRYIAHKLGKRKRDGMGEEESAVLLSGVRQPPLKVRHEISRPRNRLTTMEQAQIAAGPVNSPKTPEDLPLVVFTPPPNSEYE